MTVPDEELFAFVDGELPPEAMARIEAAMATDPQLALRVETQRSLRRLLSGAHGGGARPPEVRGAGTAPSPPEAKEAEVIAFPGAQAKKDKVKKDKARTKETIRPRDARAPKPRDESGRGFPTWIGLAACLLVGLAMGRLAAPPPVTLSGADDPPPIAAGPLAKILNTGASGVAEGPVRVALTFKTASGVYCRAFQAAGRAPVAGVACREQDAWRVRAVVPDKAGSPLPAAVLTLVDAMSAGPPLDAAAEAKARTSGWKPAR
ncbi:anti-sigma factor [Caulobacter sp. CCG-8]|uniref:anti-sigma factor family protein n=1 Tax=Caulobacter sp. CCG-8 TaxID=3127958 RepID=UPI00307F693C